MLKIMFEQFIASGAKCRYYTTGIYLYEQDEHTMIVLTNALFPYKPEVSEQFIHDEKLKIIRISFS